MPRYRAPARFAQGWARNKAFGGLGISPDGRWMLYESDESGRSEVFVQTFPTPGKKVRISTDGGFGAGWRSDGAEILYGSQRGLMTVAIRGGLTIEAGKPAFLMEVPKEALALGVTSDFKRFLFAIATGASPPTALTLVTNWTSLLER